MSYGFDFARVSQVTPLTPHGISIIAELAAAPALTRLEKYWGFIELLKSDIAPVTKRIFMRAGAQSSLEYHVAKTEEYNIASGLLKVGLRVGRAENRSIVLRPNEAFRIIPGLMHIRQAIEDTVIIEFASSDDDSDSHIVEDGRTYKHIEATP